MAGNGESDAQMLLDQYVYDYMLKRNLNQAAAIFARDANVDMSNFEAIDSPEGFLSEWWTIFWATYNSGSPTNPTCNSANSQAGLVMGNSPKNPKTAKGNSASVPKAATKKPSKNVLGSSSTYLRPNPASPSSQASPPGSASPQESKLPTSSSGKGNNKGKNKKAANFKPPAPLKSKSSSKAQMLQNPVVPIDAVIALPAKEVSTLQQNAHAEAVEHNEQAHEGNRAVESDGFSDLDIDALTWNDEEKLRELLLR